MAESPVPKTVAGGGGPTGEPVGREAELERAVAVLDELRTGAGLAVEGEPGIGKTALLAAIAEAARERRFLVLDGRADEAERTVPFAPFVDALDDHLSGVNPRSLRPAEASGRRELARVFPSIEMPHPPPPDVDGADGENRAHRAIRELLEGLAARRGLLVVLDDFQWADPESAELAAFLLRHPPRARLLLAIGRRTPAAPDPLGSAAATIERISLGPLADERARELLPDGLAEAAAARILREAGGNPFLLVELAASASTQDVPAPLVAAIGAELDRLSPADRDLALAAAVAGDPFDPALAAAIAGLPVPDALGSVDRLLAAELLRTTGREGRFSFREPVVGAAVLAAAQPGRRLAAHAAAAEALGSRGAAAATRAPHVALSAAPGDLDAVSLLAEAAGERATSDPAAAVEWLDAALELLPEQERGRSLALLAARARALVACGRFENALRDLEDVLGLLDEPTARAQVLVSTAKVMQLLSRHGEARSELERALAELPDRGSPEASALKLELAADAFFAADHEELAGWVAEALDDGERRDDRSLVAAAHGLQSAALYMQGDVERARIVLEDALAAIAALDDAEFAAHLHSHNWTALGAVYLERFEPAVELLDRGIAAASDGGPSHLPAMMRTTQALAQINLGRPEQASAGLDDAIEAAVRTHNSVLGSWATALQTWATLIRGDLPGALVLARAVADRIGSDPLSATAACYIGEVLLAAGEPEAARERLLAAAGGPGLETIEAGFRARGYEILTRAELDAGSIDGAERWALLASESAAEAGIAGRSADALRARAAVALAREEPGRALEQAGAAAEQARTAGLAIDADRAEILGARALAASGDSEAAAARLERAQASLLALGADHYADEAARELRRLGLRTRRPAAEVRQGAALSPRESEVAALVAAGKRNREIGDALFLSERTVEGHLRRVYRKLGIKSRTELAALLARRD